MAKYIYQRILIFVWVVSCSVAISGIFIPNFYDRPCQEVRIIENRETTRDQVVNYQTSDKSLGRYVKFSYLDENNIRQVEDDFWPYENTMGKTCSPSYYKLTRDKKYSETRGWVLGIVLFFSILSTILLPFSLIDEMDLEHDYRGDEKDIGFLRLNIFNFWNSFCGYPHDLLYSYCEQKAEEMNNCSSYKYKIPEYGDMKKEFIEYIEKKKSEVTPEESVEN